jgi:hypothetical protein
LADVLSIIIRRVRGAAAAVPILAAYDRSERIWLAPSPWLFQHRYSVENRRICGSTIRNMLNVALVHTGLIDPPSPDERSRPHGLAPGWPATPLLRDGLMPATLELVVDLS